MKSPESSENSLNILDYAEKNHLPEVDEAKIAGLPKYGWAIEFKSGIQHMRSNDEIRLVSVVEDDPPLAISSLAED